jgi:hypothetical protein
MDKVVVTCFIYVATACKHSYGKLFALTTTVKDIVDWAMAKRGEADNLRVASVPSRSRPTSRWESATTGVGTTLEDIEEITLKNLLDEFGGRRCLHIRCEPVAMEGGTSGALGSALAEIMASQVRGSRVLPAPPTGSFVRSTRIWRRNSLVFHSSTQSRCAAARTPTGPLQSAR